MQQPGDKINTIKSRLPRWAKKIALEIGAAESEIESILIRKWLDYYESEIDVTSVKYRADEYAALSGKVSSSSGFFGDFSREEMPIDEYHLPHIKSISLIDKVKVVNALIGFSRINPVVGKNDAGFVHVKEPDTRWYPAYEVRGEGIFIEFAQNDIDEWILNNPSVIERVHRINENYAMSFIEPS